jgi:hypothetical protein
VIARNRRGWTTPANAAVHDALPREDILAGIAGRPIEGWRGERALRSGDAELVVLMRFDTRFDSLDAARAFAGDDDQAAAAPPRARELLRRLDARPAHCQIRASA